MYRLLSILMLVLAPCVHTLSAVDKEGALTAAIEEVRQNLAAKLGKTIPSINVLINTPVGLYYTSAGQKEFKNHAENKFPLCQQHQTFHGRSHSQNATGWLAQY